MKTEKKINLKKILSKRNVAIFLLIISVFSYYYKDSNSIMRQSLKYWECLFNGEFFRYYKSGGGAWGILLHTALAIWHLPVYIISRILPDMDVKKIFLIRIYSKMFNVVFILFSGKLFRRICKSTGLKEEDGDLAYLMFMTGAMTLAAFSIAGQCDMPGIFLSLLALSYFLEEKEVPFLIAFTFAVQCKFFPLFIFVPLILYRYKNIFSCIWRVLMPVCVYALFQLPFMMSTGSSDTNGGQRIVMKNLFGDKIQVFGSDTYLIWILFCLVCIYAYVKKTEKGKAFTWDALYLGTAGLMLTMLPVYVEPYRFAYLSALLPLLILLRKDSLPARFAVYTVFEASTVLGGMYADRHVYDIQNMGGMLWDKILPMRKFEFPTLSATFDFLDKAKITPFYTVFTAMFAAFTIYFLYEYHPGKIKLHSEENETILPIHYYLREAVCFIAPCITCVYYIYGVFRNFVLHFFPNINLPI